MFCKALLFCFLVSVNIASAQVTFFKEYKIGAEAEGHAILTSGNNYVMAGIASTPLLDSNFVFLVKTDSIGDTLWTRTYYFKQTLYISNPNAIQFTSDGGYLLTGFARNATEIDSIFILRAMSDGTMMWFRFLSIDSIEIAANSIQPTLDGGSIVGGHYFPTLTQQNIFMSKLDSWGNTVWSKGIVVDNDAQTTCIRATADSGYIITGEAARRLFMVKTNKNGGVTWSKVYAGSNPYDIANTVRQTSDGGYILSGTLIDNSSGASRMFLLKTNSDGDQQWAHSYVGTSEFLIAANGAEAIETSDNGFALAGYTVQPGSDDYYICLIKTDAGGNITWTRTFGTNTAGNAGAFALKQTADNGFIITGKSNDAFLLKTDSTGKANCNDSTITIITGNPNLQTFFALIQDSTVSASISMFPLKMDRGAIVNTVCNPIGIEETNSDAGDFILYPNPSDGKFSVFVNQKIELRKLKLGIFDITGREVIEAANILSPTFNFQLPPGIYFVRISGEGKSITRKLVIQ